MNALIAGRSRVALTKNPRLLSAVTERLTYFKSRASIHNHCGTAHDKRKLPYKFGQSSLLDGWKEAPLKQILHKSKLQFSTNEIEIGEELCVSLEDLEKGVKNDDLLLIDVRRQDEVDAGRIPAKRFIHVPLDQVDEAFKMTNSDFKTKYGTDKPSIDSNDVVFYCRSGRRSGLALGIVHPLGYSKTKHFSGGWLEWSAKEG